MFASKLIALLPALAVAFAAPSPMADPDSISCGSGGCGGSSASSGSPYAGSVSGSVSSGNLGSSGWSGSSGQSSSWSGSGSSCSSGDCGGSGGGEIMEATTIISSPMSYSTPTYGSGSLSSGGDLQSCLNMCQAQFGSGSSSGMSSGSSSSSSGSSSSGTSTSSSASTTHTVIVAPSLGVLRYVPFAVNANPGDTIHYLWGAGPHTVTGSDGENICNRSTTAPGNFDSGKQNATATFDVPVSDNNTQFAYCTVPGHCQKGMFGVVNPPSTTVNNNLTELATGTTSAPGGPSTAGAGQVIGCSDNSINCWMNNWMNSGAGPMATGTAVKQACGSSGAWSWGGSWDMSSVVTEVITKEIIITNILYSRLMMSMNPSMLVPGSSIPSNWQAPPELNTFVAQNAANTTSTGSAATNATVPVAGTESSSSGSATAAAASTTSTHNAASARSMSSVATVLLGFAGIVISQAVL